MRYELTDLRLFLEIAKARNLSAGAAAVYITASSASYRLKNLEQAIGAALFTRTPRGMALTLAGEAALAHVRKIFDTVGHMHDDVGRFISGFKGHVCLAANSSSLHGFVTASIGRFLVSNPDVNVDIEERPSETIPAAVQAREVDFGIFAGPTDVGDLNVHRYAMDTLLIAAPPDHPLATAKNVNLAQALDFDFVCMNRFNSNFLFLNEMSQRIGKPLRARLHAHSFDAVLALVGMGLGLALIPSCVLDKVPAGVVTLPLPETWARRELNLALRADNKLAPFAQALVQFLLEDPQVAATRTP